MEASSLSSRAHQFSRILLRSLKRQTWIASFLNPLVLTHFWHQQTKPLPPWIQTSFSKLHETLKVVEVRANSWSNLRPNPSWCRQSLLPSANNFPSLLDLCSDFLVKHVLKNVVFTSSIPMNDPNGIEVENIDKRPVTFQRKPSKYHHIDDDECPTESFPNFFRLCDGEWSYSGLCWHNGNQWCHPCSQQNSPLSAEFCACLCQNYSRHETTFLSILAPVWRLFFYSPQAFSLANNFFNFISRNDA